MRWILSLTPAQLATYGLWYEHPQWTRSWTHGQIAPPGSRNRFFVPYSNIVANPATCEPLFPEQCGGKRVLKSVPVPHTAIKATVVRVRLSRD